MQVQFDGQTNFIFWKMMCFTAVSNFFVAVIFSVTNKRSFIFLFCLLIFIKESNNKDTTDSPRQLFQRITLSFSALKRFLYHSNILVDRWDSKFWFWDLFICLSVLFLKSFVCFICIDYLRQIVFFFFETNLRQIVAGKKWIYRSKSEI